MLLQGVDLRKCGGVKPIVVVHGSQRAFTGVARKPSAQPRVKFEVRRR
jgi:hypothetical protein